MPKTRLGRLTRFLPFEKAAINIKSTDIFSTCELWFEVFFIHQQIVNPTFVLEIRSQSAFTSTTFIRIAIRERAESPRNIKMTVSHNRQNLSVLEAQAEIQLFTPGGQVDVAGSDEANKQIFSEANVVRLPGGGIDVVASHAKRLVTKAAILASKK
jgi:hypothetical protein